MSIPITPERELLRLRAFNLSCEDQHWLAQVIASNVGYDLVADDQDTRPTLADRVERLEAAVRELNPGLNL